MEKELCHDDVTPAFISDSYDPRFNLAVEECIFRQMPATSAYCSLAQCRHGGDWRAQNPWKECNTRRMEEDHVRLARSSSGGGAVFHDWATLALHLWQASRNTIKPSLRRLC